jgi:hypothetical protein
VNLARKGSPLHAWPVYMRFHHVQMSFPAYYLYVAVESVTSSFRFGTIHCEG